MCIAYLGYSAKKHHSISCRCLRQKNGVYTPNIQVNHHIPHQKNILKKLRIVGQSANSLDLVFNPNLLVASLAILTVKIIESIMFSG